MDLHEKKLGKKNFSDDQIRKSKCDWGGCVMRWKDSSVIEQE